MLFVKCSSIKYVYFRSQFYLFKILKNKSLELFLKNDIMLSNKVL
jgi:hypothetical protein